MKPTLAGIIEALSAPRIISVVAAAILLACLLDGCTAGHESSKAASLKPEKSRPLAPDFSLKDADGKTVHLSDYKGKVVLLDFWATTCGPCRLEMPWFENLQRTRKDKGFEVLGISVGEDTWAEVKPFLARMKVNYRIVMGDDAVTHAYGDVDAIPTTLLIDKQGKIAAVHVGVDSGPEDFAASVDTLLREGENSAGNTYLQGRRAG